MNTSTNTEQHSPTSTPKLMPIPTDPKKIVLVNPTKYLGNLLIAGGLIQDYARECADRNSSLLVVLDETFRELVGDSLPAAETLWYPRAAIRRASAFKAARLYLSCLMKIRAFDADLALVVEEDTVAHRLTTLSGARFKLGCASSRHGRGYDQVLDIEFARRPLEQRHRWYSYQEVFAAVGAGDIPPGYIQLNPSASAKADGILGELRSEVGRPIVVLHTGATKAYKKWPLPSFCELAELLHEAGFACALAGAGPDDKQANTSLKAQLAEKGIKVQDLTDQLSLAELARFLSQTQGFIGNDSGPFHLASALGVPGCSIYGPTELELWGPLNPVSRVVRSEQRPCVKACREPSCLFDNQCLRAVSPRQVMDAFQSIISQAAPGTV